MRSPYCVFRNRLIALSICLCALLAFSTTLSADTILVIGGTSPGSYTPTNPAPSTAVSEPDGPYAGILTINGVQQPNTLFFCLTGNQGLDTTEYGAVYNPYNAPTPPSNIAYEEAAYLASLLLTNAANDKFSVTSNGSTVSVTPLAGNSMSLQTFEAQVLGPLQMAIWEVMGTMPAGDATDTNSYTVNFVSQANNNYQHYSYSNVEVFTWVAADNPPCSNTHGQSFISVNTLTSTPEPGTMVLFGTGVLLMGLGSARKLLARRRAR